MIRLISYYEKINFYRISLPGVMVVKGNRSAPSHCQSMDDSTV
ncbi:hypothetical protein T06_1785 [Trichinella sp. T6]|nr:hypothetical protein T06_13374 [Trichinella sp. T6]KRX50882.1 hypothetical protein T06_1785 [Trichinella sp. T6]